MKRGGGEGSNHDNGLVTVLCISVSTLKAFGERGEHELERPGAPSRGQTLFKVK